jgi:large subunit ribosomal protein L29
MLVRMRLNHAITPLENPQKLKQAKLTIARLLTELRARETKQKSK